MRHAVPIGTPGSAVNPANGFAWTRVGHTIHVSKKTLLNNPDLAVISLIHEGSHKFANTWDHGDKGYREEDDSDWELPGQGTVESERDYPKAPGGLWSLGTFNLLPS